MPADTERGYWQFCNQETILQPNLIYNRDFNTELSAVGCKNCAGHQKELADEGKIDRSKIRT